MKKNLTKALALALCAFTVAPMAACGNPTGEKIDETKTQLTVFHYFAGFGDEWLVELKENFEEKVKGISFEPGKTGVQVHHRGEMRDFTASQIKSEGYDVLFLESPKEFLTIMNEFAVEPLDSIMETPNAADNNQTIVGKMTEQQKNFYYHNGHYYGIPHYAGHYGLIYNRELFEEKGFFLAENPDEATGDILVNAANPERTAGPDGIKGNDDDGLPRTYDEFFALCEEINARGVDPVCFPGQYTQQHLMLLLDNLVAQHEGAEQMNINYTFEGTATDLVKLDKDGYAMLDENGNPIIDEPLEINSSNAWQMSRQAGRYYGIQFMHKLLSNNNYINEEDGKNTAMSHTMNQQNFLENQSLGKRPSAMLADGSWWQIEADDVFSYMAEDDAKYSKENRKFGWLPLPQATEEEAQKLANGEKKSVYMDYLNAVACVKAGLADGPKAAALEFLKYAYTDEALANFTYTTGTTIGVDYMDALDRNELNYYETSLIDYIQKSDRVYQVSPNEFYAANRQKLVPSQIYGSGTYVSMERAVWDEHVSAKEYFKGHIAFYKGIAWN